MFVNDPMSWKYATCENCRKNEGKEIVMKREEVAGTILWVCPRCGATKTL